MRQIETDLRSPMPMQPQPQPQPQPQQQQQQQSAFDAEQYFAKGGQVDKVRRPAGQPKLQQSIERLMKHV
jgi:hypothetical protein